MKMLMVLKDIKAMPYYKNYAAVSGAVHNIANHEKAVEDIFCKHGLNKVKIEQLLHKGITKKKLRNMWLAGGDHSNLPDNSYIPQPCGKQDHPDFIIKVNGKIYFIECKSSTEPSPTFNSNYAHKGYIYVFTSEKYNATTVFRGEDIVGEKSAELYEEMKKEIAIIEKKYAPLITEADANLRGLSYYNREMYTQSGLKEQTDYFIHSDRERCEQRVMELVS